MNIDSDGVITFTIQPHGCSACGHQHGGRDVAYVCVGCPCPETPGRPPPDWYDGTPKPCPGAGELPRVVRTGEITEHGEPVYFSRCAYCDKPRQPGEPMEPHTFIPWDLDAPVTFTAGRVPEGIEPGTFELAPDGCLATDHARGEHTPARPAIAIRCDGDHPEPPCAARQCWRRTPLRSAAAEARLSEAQELGCEDDELVRADLHEIARGECHCSGFRCSKHLAQDELRKHRPHVVVLCGSTRFYSEFVQANYDETMKGNIVLSVGFAREFAESKEPVRRELHGENIGCTPEQKLALDDLHKQKIDLADEVFVLNVGGYIGKSTAGEIEYAEMCGKPIRWLVAP
ncbi:MAG TPA: hypothetical protein VJZ73_13300 [Methylomirabilota bacterium]|nr:hypothetical protein [Methylomirabilota bacterium]